MLYKYIVKLKFCNLKHLYTYIYLLDKLFFYIEFKCHVTFHFYSNNNEYNISNTLPTFKKRYKEKDLTNILTLDIQKFIERYNIDEQIILSHITFRYIKKNIVINMYIRVVTFIVKKIIDWIWINGKK